MAAKFQVLADTTTSIGGILSSWVGAMGGTAEDMRKASEAGDTIEGIGLGLGGGGSKGPDISPRGGTAVEKPSTVPAPKPAAAPSQAQAGRPPGSSPVFRGEVGKTFAKAFIKKSGRTVIGEEVTMDVQGGKPVRVDLLVRD